ncbi:hypothetical protein NQ317_004028 [Molorchus minor]|uniref:Cytoplasmic tRNA 2-thiolation protein 2 n=1 Tax=Molorchus minor TaxID=1323400 RepID=A0ABQ9JV64_9CUCU|nr:hypothetical protein NQ317_004028 [Molorchus minor]
MCSIGDEEFEDGSFKIMTKKEKFTLSNKCNKCRVADPCVVLRLTNVYCKCCFLASTTHKFQSVLGKSLLHFLHFLKTRIDLNTPPKKCRYKVVVIFIEDQYQLSLKEREDVIKKITHEVLLFGFMFYCVSFITYMVNPGQINKLINEDLQLSEKDNETLCNILDKNISETNRKQILNLAKRRLLIEISTDTASLLLTNICLGRGSQVPVDSGFCDDREEIKILRPLRLFDIKELAFYNRLNNLEPVFVRQREVNHYLSVNNLMRQFIDNLQQNYPATVTTVVKTGDKLTLDRTNTHICKLCKSLVPKNNSELSSEESTRFSHLVSTTVPNYTISRQERYQDISTQFESVAINDHDYCYACSKMYPFIKNIENSL